VSVITSASTPSARHAVITSAWMRFPINAGIVARNEIEDCHSVLIDHNDRVKTKDCFCMLQECTTLSHTVFTTHVEEEVIAV
jgi:hypothetical protein